MSRLGIACRSVVFVHAMPQGDVFRESGSVWRTVVFVHAMPSCGDFVIFSLPWPFCLLPYRRELNSAVSSSEGWGAAAAERASCDRRTMCMAAVRRAYDGRRTCTKACNGTIVRKKTCWRMDVLYSLLHSRRPSSIVKRPPKTDALYRIFRGYRPSPMVKRLSEADVMYSFFYSCRLSPIVKSPSRKQGLFYDKKLRQSL